MTSPPLRGWKTATIPLIASAAHRAPGDMPAHWYRSVEHVNPTRLTGGTSSHDKPSRAAWKTHTYPASDGEDAAW